MLQETIRPKAKLPPLLCKLTERPSEKLNYIGVSYGLTKELLKFWKKAGYLPVYLRQVQVWWVLTESVTYTYMKYITGSCVYVRLEV